MMRRSVFVAAIAALAMQRARPANAAAPVRIAVLGDSLALGTGATRADGGFIFRAYRALLATRPGSRIDNVAIGGATVADVLRLQVTRLAHVSYDAVIVCAGGNDVVHQTDASVFQATYDALLTRIARTVPQTRIVCCGVPDVSVSPIFAGARAEIGRIASADDRAVRNLAATHHASFADLFDVSRGHGDAARFLGHDRFHPSDAGYALLERSLTPVLERALVTKA